MGELVFGLEQRPEARGTDPKNLRVFVIFRFSQTSRQVRRLSEGAGAARRLFDGADTTGEIRFTSVSRRRKQKRRILFAYGNRQERLRRRSAVMVVWIF
jgi:hypothetical protein